MKGSFYLLSLLVLLALVQTISAAVQIDAPTNNVQILTSSVEQVTLKFDHSGISHSEIVQDENAFDSFRIQSEGFTYEYDKPILPAVSRFVVVPADADLELIIHSDEPASIPAENSPIICLEGEPADRQVDLSGNDSELYPPQIAEMSEPIVIRGVRIVCLTTYPVQYDSKTNRYIHHRNIEAEIRFTDAEPVNPARTPTRRNRSHEFLRFIQTLVINGDDVSRDDPDADQEPEYIGHYLVVAHANCVEYIVDFIEWRRKSGWKVEILSIPENPARNDPRQTKALIQERYDEYLDNDIDPFDNILLVGDRTGYPFTQFIPQWILNAENGATIFPNPPHADYLYGCLEGNDDFPDVAISRWCAGNERTLGLFVGRTLSYEANPYMEDTDWFTKGGVFSNHWGNGPDIGTWDITIQSNVRWGVEVLEYLGFDDIRFHEDFEWRGRPDNVLGEFERNLHNEGVNLLLGRTRNHYWWRDYQGVDDNIIFPIRLLTSGHSEWPVWNMLRTGDRNHLKGPVAATCGWGNPQTIGMNITWLEMVNGMLLKDLSLGWMRLYVLLGPMQYIPNFYQGFNRHVKADFDVYGDPAIQHWNGVPRVLEFEYPESITTRTRMVEVYVFNPDEDVDESGAQVTLYAAGDMPDPDDEDYVDYDEMFMLTKKTDVEGVARFIFDEEAEFDPGIMLVTVTGRDILPLFGELEIIESQRAIGMLDYDLEKIEGMDNGEINPNDVLNLSLTAVNLGDEAIENVIATVSSNSQWIEVADNEIALGNLGANEETAGDTTVTLVISLSCPDGASRPVTRPEIIVDFSSGDESWRSGIRLNPSSPNFVVTQVIGDNVIGLDEEALNIEIENIGSMNSQNMEAEIYALSFGINVLSGIARYPAIETGSTARIQGNLFSVTGNSIVVPGSIHEMMLILTNEDDFIDTAYFELQVGEARANAPLGPDTYGYVCFDDTDQDWEIAPTYDWIEISLDDNDRDFDGARFEFDGRSPHDIGEAIVIPLGFTTQFYGNDYDTITVAVNGFISMGSQPLAVNFQNWPLDRCIGGGVGMIAPLWDNLRLTDNSGIFWYNDEDEHRFIIEWYRMRHRSGGDNDLTFQIIIYDRDFRGTPSGDTNILMQYKHVSNRQRNGDWIRTVPFASVGISSPDGRTGISYTFNNNYPIQAARLQDRRAILFTTLLSNLQTGVLYGHVIDSANDNPISGALVFTSFGQGTNTDDNGYWIIEDAFAEVPFNVTARIQGFNDSTLTGFELEEDDTLEIDFALLHPEFEPSTLNLSAVIDPGVQTELPFRIDNNGNGILEWMLDARLPGNAGMEPWRMRQDYLIGQTLDDSRILGVVFFDSLFYVSGANDGNPTIYIINKDGELIDTLAQPGENNRGMKDLAYDGELIWGSIGNTVYGLTPEGEVVRSFQGPYDIISLITWDPDRECLWLGCTTSNPVAIDRLGNPIEGLEIDRNGLRMYGLAYYQDDPDNSPLYIFHKERDTNRQTIHKANIETGESIFVAYLEPEDGGSPCGAYITNTFDIYSWVFLAVANASGGDRGDRIDIWQLEGRMDWFSFEVETDDERTEATEGLLLPGDHADFVLSFDAADIVIGRYDVELHFFHNAIGGHTQIDGLLDVTGPVPPQRFGLIEPLDGDTLHSTEILFAWQPSFDPNEGEVVSYLLWISSGSDSCAVNIADTAFTVSLDTVGIGLNYADPVHWWVKAVSGEDTTECDERFIFHIDVTGSDLSENNLPVEFGLRSVYPNPFNSITRITFGINRPDRTILRIYDLNGREILKLTDKVWKTDYHSVIWNAGNIPAGIYLLNINSRKKMETRKIILIR